MSFGKHKICIEIERLIKNKNFNISKTKEVDKIDVIL